MVSFSPIDIFILISFFAAVIAAGLYAAKKNTGASEDYLLSGRKVGLFLFVTTSVSTWYGGILGIGEFTFNYGLLSWLTQGLPYYLFAILFAIFFAGKIRTASLFTIPDKIRKEYGDTAGVISSVIVFILVSPAPYLLMTANLISLVFNISIIWSLLLSLILSLLYLVKGGFRSDLYTDVIQFFVMFAGFAIIVFASYYSSGGITFLQEKLPQSHLKLTGNASPVYILVWFLIASWTFADPGFHQRCYAAKSGRTAKTGILISVILWALFDFLTTSTGLYARAILPADINPVLSFPLLAERILAPGFKGFFYAALFATIMSTLNSFLFLSGTTLGKDFIYNLAVSRDDSKLRKFTILGLILSGVTAVIIAILIPSVIGIWYTIGSIFIPGIIFPVIGAYYSKFMISRKLVIAEMLLAVVASAVWYFLRNSTGIEISQIEPMIAGLLTAGIIHLWGLIKKTDGKTRQP